MRKKLILLVLPLLLLLGCSAQTPAQPPLSFRTALLQAGGCCFTADITADYGQTVTNFTLQCTFSPETGAQLTVTEPASIAGITAHVDESAAYVSYDDTQLALGTLANGTLAPLAAPYVLGQCWAGEYIDSTGKDGEFLRATYRMGYEEAELIVDTWFSDDPFVPVCAEISFDGRMILRAALSDFSLQSPKQDETL